MVYIYVLHLSRTRHTHTHTHTYRRIDHLHIDNAVIKYIATVPWLYVSSSRVDIIFQLVIIIIITSMHVLYSVPLQFIFCGSSSRPPIQPPTHRSITALVNCGRYVDRYTGYTLNRVQPQVTPSFTRCVIPELYPASVKCRARCVDQEVRETCSPEFTPRVRPPAAHHRHAGNHVQRDAGTTASIVIRPSEHPYGTATALCSKFPPILQDVRRITNLSEA